MDLEDKIAKIQQSTRTTLPFFVPVHNALRMRFRWYYRWHLSKYSTLIHSFILALFTMGMAGMIFQIYQTGISPSIADNSPVAITITSEADFNANSTATNVAIDPTGYVSINNRNAFTNPGGTFSHSTCTEMYQPSNIADGDPDTMDAICGTGNWVEWDFGVTKDFNRVKISAQEIDTEAGSGPQYSLQYWDGSTWQTAFTELGAGHGAWTDHYVSVSTDKIRIAYAGMVPAAPEEIIEFYEIALYNSSTGTIVSGNTQFDGGDNLDHWTTVAANVTIPANTNIDFRFRSSDDATNWGSWSALTAYAASLDMTSILGVDADKRYLQVETTLENGDGESTPTLLDITASYINKICPAGTTSAQGSVVVTTQSEWDLGSKTNLTTSNDQLTMTERTLQYTDIAGNLLSSSINYDYPDGTIDEHFDLGQTFTDVSRVSWVSAGPAGYLRFSTDNVNWTTATTLYDASNVEDFTPLDVRYVRISDTCSYQYSCSIAEVRLFQLSATATHISASTQLDGTANIAAWTTFTSDATVPANTTLSYRFRTSSDSSNWGSWTAPTPYAASLDLTTLLSDEDIVKRYLQVETTLANTDGASTPTLNSYTANYTACTPDEATPTCSDGIQNGDETGVDCGGSCGACTPTPTCSDGIQNGDETGIDCGGSCSACTPEPTCSDNLKNGDETGVDCGGSCAACPVEPTCSDNVQNGDETGVDCGGSCEACPAEPTCSDGVKNGDETEVDCGGSCTACPVDATCSDGVQNGNETGVDCGGSCSACPVPETCSDGIKNQNETGVDTGGVCGEQCKLNECSSQAITDFVTCQNQAAQGNTSYAACASSYCAAIKGCYADCGITDVIEQNVFVVTPNGGESYHINSTVPLRWYYTAADKKSKISIGDLPVKMSISLDGGASYTAIKTLIPANNPNSAYVAQYRATEPSLDIGTYHNVADSSDLEYSWIPGNPDYVSDSVRIKLEPYLYNCAVLINSDASNNNFRLYTNNTQDIFLKIEPTTAKVEPGEEAMFEVSAFLADGSDVTSSTSFNYLVSNTAVIKNFQANKVTLIAGDNTGIFDRALQVTANRNGSQASIYGGLEIYSPANTPAPDDCIGLCRVVDYIRKTVKGLAASSEAQSSLAQVALVVGLFNTAISSLSLFQNLIAPFIKGKEKNKAKSLVYDAVTGQPLNGAHVMLLNSGLKTLSQMSVSNQEGKYSLEISPDKEYEIKVDKDGYTQYNGQGNRLDREGLIYDHNYLGGLFKSGPEQYVFDYNLPLIETNPGETAKEIWRKSRISQLLIALNFSILLLGSGLAVIVFIAFPTTINYLILSLYVLILGYYLVNRAIISGRSFGTVVNASLKDQPVDLALIRAVRQSDHKLAKTVVSDIKGRFTLMLPKGKYLLFVSKEGLHQIEHIEIEIKSSFAPRHDTVKMETIENAGETAVNPASGASHGSLSVNSPSELIDKLHNSQQEK